MNSGSSIQCLFPPSDPPSASAISVPPLESDIAQPLAPFDRQGDDAGRPGRQNKRQHKRPHQFDPPVSRVTGKIQRKDSKSSSFSQPMDILLSDLHTLNVDQIRPKNSSEFQIFVVDNDFNHPEVAMVSDIGCESVEVDEMALQQLPTETNNASIPVVTATKGESNELLQFKEIFSSFSNLMSKCSSNFNSVNTQPQLDLSVVAPVWFAPQSGGLPISTSVAMATMIADASNIVSSSLVPETCLKDVNYHF